MGKPRDPLYWQQWRAAHPEYRDRERTRVLQRYRQLGSRLWHPHRVPLRPAKPRLSVDTTPLPDLFPDMWRAATYSYRYDELRMDIRQERALAELEGRSPDEAEAALRRAENAWLRNTVPLRE